jgi:uncharacterized protein
VSLEMRTVCERCGTALAYDGPAFICSYECTFCASCASDMDHVCPNCGGELVARPRRRTDETPLKPSNHYEEVYPSLLARHTET